MISVESVFRISIVYDWYHYPLKKGYILYQPVNSTVMIKNLNKQKISTYLHHTLPFFGSFHDLFLDVRVMTQHGIQIYLLQHEKICVRLCSHGGGPWTGENGGNFSKESTWWYCVEHYWIGMFKNESFFTNKMGVDIFVSDGCSSRPINGYDVLAVPFFEAEISSLCAGPWTYRGKYRGVKRLKDV